MSDHPTSALATLIAEAKRRYVFRAVGLYAAAAFVVLQLADILLPAFGLSDAAVQYLLIVIAAGFPLVVIVTWIVDFTPEGVKLTPGLTPGEQATLAPGRAMDLVIIVVALGVGYLYLERLLTGDEVAVVGEPALQEEAQPEPEQVPPQELEPSIAVLPFDNISTSDENAVFADGIHEDILDYLSRNSQLMVTSRQSTLAYRDADVPMAQIAADLGVNYLMEGSVRRAGQQIKVTVQLIEAVSDIHIWSEVYERTLDDVFAIQDEIAQEVAARLKVQFELYSEGRPTESLAAYELYLEARALFEEAGPVKTRLSISRYREALQLDRNYANAWAGLSLAATTWQSDEDLEEARTAAEQAMELDAASWMSNWAMASYLANWRVEQYVEAGPHFLKAIELNPNHGKLRSSYGYSLWAQGRMQEAGAQFRESYRRNPLSAEANLARADAAVFDNQADLAEKHVVRALELEITRPFLFWWAGNTYQMLGQQVNAATYYQKALTLEAAYVPAMRGLSDVFGALGDFETDSYWLDQAEAVDPDDTGTLMRRRENLYDQRRLPETIQFVEGWLEREPNNHPGAAHRGLESRPASAPGVAA